MTTLGGLLYSSGRRTPIPEADWVTLIHAIAGGDHVALHSLYVWAHRPVYTFIMRITGSHGMAEELTLDVFSDIWRDASHYDPVDGTVLCWIMNRARSHAMACRREQQRTTRPDPQVRDPRDTSTANAAVDVLQPSETLQQRLARIIAANGDDTALPAPPAPQPEWDEVGPGIFCRLLAADTERHRISMLVRLLPGILYPPHTHAGREELHLLHGELWIEDRKLRAGDYNRAEANTRDRRVWSATGCTCVLHTSTLDTLG